LREGRPRALARARLLAAAFSSHETERDIDQDTP